jgi:hypothetical protein
MDFKTNSYCIELALRSACIQALYNQGTTEVIEHRHPSNQSDVSDLAIRLYSIFRAAGTIEAGKLEQIDIRLSACLTLRTH